MRGRNREGLRTGVDELARGIRKASDVPLAQPGVVNWQQETPVFPTHAKSRLRDASAPATDPSQHTSGAFTPLSSTPFLHCLCIRRPRRQQLTAALLVVWAPIRPLLHCRKIVQVLRLCFEVPAFGCRRAGPSTSLIRLGVGVRSQGTELLEGRFSPGMCGDGTQPIPLFAPFPESSSLWVRGPEVVRPACVLQQYSSSVCDTSLRGRAAAAFLLQDRWRSAAAFV